MTTDVAALGRSRVSVVLTDTTAAFTQALRWIDQQESIPVALGDYRQAVRIAVGVQLADYVVAVAENSDETKEETT